MTAGPEPAPAAEEFQPLPPVHAAPPSQTPTEVHPTLASASGDHCPSCGAHMAADQRYCLECGQRRGDPRLPVMDAVVFMDVAKRPSQTAAPAPPSGKKPRVSANASLIAGVGTLLLAMGIGVLIGKTGEGGSSTANAPAQVITVGGGTGTGATTTPGEANEGAKGKSKGGASKAKAKAKSETGTSGTSKAVEEVFKPAPGVKLPPQKVKPGGKCASGTTGCEGGKFTGNFFGE